MTQRAPLGKAQLQDLADQYSTWSDAARAIGIPATTVRTRAQQFGIIMEDVVQPSLDPREVIEIGERTASAEFTEATVNPDDVPTDGELLRRANLDDDWEVVSRRTSVWAAQEKGGGERIMRSLRVTFRKRQDADLLLPAFGGAPVVIKPPARVKRNVRDTELVAIVSDFHCPYFDNALLKKAEQLLLSCQPDRLIINGDLVDFPTATRHRKTTLNCTASANECIQSGGEVLGRLRAAVPDDCQIQFLPGNHDSWLSAFLIDRAGPAYDLCVTGSDVPVWSLRSLLRLDELGIEIVGSEDQWQHAMIRLTDLLVVRHGMSIRVGSAASVLANMRSSEYATITGHTHRMGLATKALWKANGKHKIVQGAEIGGMFQMPRKPTDWPTYVVNPDWQPGFATVEIEHAPGFDGHFSIDLASWQNGTLMHRGVRW